MLLNERIRGLGRGPLLFWSILVEGRYDFIYDQMPLSVRGMSARKRINLLRAGLNLVWRRSRPWSYPLHMQFELANFCQLRCPACPTGSGELNRKPAAMDPRLFEQVMEEVGPFLLTASLWGWGESLLHPRLGEFLSIAARHPVVTMLSTNGQNLNQERVIQAICNAPPTYLIVAVEGLDDETHASFRHGARLTPLLEGVRRIAEIKRQRGMRLPVLHLRFIVLKSNQHQVPMVRDFALANGFEMFSLRRLSIYSSGHGAEVASALRIRIQEREPPQDRFICMQPFWFPSVCADGSLVLCEQDFNAEAALGRIERGVDFKNLWWSTTAARLRRRLLRNPESFSFCSHCPELERRTTDVSFHAEFLVPWLEKPLVVTS